MYIYKLGSISDKKKALKSLGVESGGVGIMAKKMELMVFFIKDLKCPAANILKQDALSVGADLAVPGGVILCEKELYDCMLIGSRKHMEILSRKELAQPFGLKTVAKELLGLPIGKGAPSVNKMIFSKGVEEGLMPGPENYKNWTNMFVKNGD